MSEQSSDLADDIIPELPQHIERRRLDFQPWHKVRKQFIRERQWNKMISELADRHLQLQTVPDNPAESGEAGTNLPANVLGSAAGTKLNIDPSPNGYPLTCLAIPGDDLLDLRSLHKEIEDRGYRLKYLGFNQGHGSHEEGTRVHVANNEVTSLKGVVKSSCVLRDPFQAISRDQSIAYKYLRDYGPFHVVNLDICDSLFPTTSTPYGSYYDAIHRLAGYQLRFQTTPWLLFITTQVEPGTMDREGLAKLCKPTRDNCNSHPEFLAQLSRLFPSHPFQSREGEIEFTALAPEHINSVFGVGLGKWLLSLCVTATPSWSVRMMASYKYTINHDLGVEMLSLAFKFSPVVSPPVDLAGMSSIQMPSQKPPDELATALKIITAVGGIRDVDDLLSKDAELNSGLEQTSADLMERAGFHKESYIAWMRSQGTSLQQFS